jgi:hypothetical protein
MSTRRGELFSTVRTEGGLLPPSLLSRIAAADGALPGLRTEDYHLAPGERITEAINRSWSRLVGAWASFTEALAAIPADNPAQGLTYDRWLLILFSELGYGRLQRAAAVEIDGTSYPVSHAWGNAPIHLVGAHVDLDRRSKGVAGAARVSPHGLVQNLLNRSDERLWGFLSNGLRLRILRDNLALTRQAFVEFDLQAMMDGEIYSDFVVLWLLAHQSRVEATPSEDCWLERWCVEARTQGTRALDYLRDSVEAGIAALGSGFLAHPNNAALRTALRDGTIWPIDYYRQLLRVVYRLLFLLVAEQRDLLLLPALDSEAASPSEIAQRLEARARYNAYYSVTRIRELSERRRGTRHVDLWQQIQLVVRLLGTTGCDTLALPAIGSYLFSPAATPELHTSRLPNSSLLAAIRALSGRDDDEAGYRWLFDYTNLGVEELGSVYESLLELHPDIDLGSNTFTLATGGKERRATGSHYTPPTILKRVLDFAVEPAVARALATPDPVQALLDLRVLDPAVGSGHFLIAVAHRIARALATVRTGEAEPTPNDIRLALREVVARCLYGVDLNPMAVELCRVALWLETLQPGKPLSFLDHHIQVGNSLLGVPLGTTVARNRTAVEARRRQLEQRIAEVDARCNEFPALDPKTNELHKEKAALRREIAQCVYDSWADAIPDEAFKPAPDDDKVIARRWARDNRLARKTGQMQLPGDVPVELSDELVGVFQRLGGGAEDTVAEVTIRAETFEGVQRRSEYAHLVDLADAWTAAFFWPLVAGAPQPPYQASFLTLHSTPGALPADTAAKVSELADVRRFFHFELAFPEVFTSERGGFDIVVGNPPYLGGQRIGVTFGNAVFEFLKAMAADTMTSGRIDLAAHFLRRGFDLLRQGGDVCFITTNTIAQGDSREASLEPIIASWGGTIANAIRSQPWEGQATVSVAVVHVHRGEWPGDCTLDGVAVDHISSDLTCADSEQQPVPLDANRDVVGIGSNILGEGFWITADDRERLIADDGNNAIVIKPFVGGRHAMQSPHPGMPERWVIDFGDRSLEEAAAFIEPMRIVRTRVKPQRDAMRRANYRERWWRHGEPSTKLYARIRGRGLTRVIVIPHVSKWMLPTYLPADFVYQDKLFVFADEDPALFGVLSSSFHSLWAAKWCTTMRADPTYSPTIFLTFARPEPTEEVRRVAQELDTHRAPMMRQHDEGMTKIYNRVADPAEVSPDVARLRDIHIRLDVALAAAYGWNDLDWGHGLHPTERFGLRWTAMPETQREIERRLLDLNLKRAVDVAS